MLQATSYKLQASQGKLIVLDGIDGSGKATQTKLLVEKLKAEGFSVETMDFPQYENNFFGQMVRRYLNGEFGPATAVSPYLASVLYAGDRFESSEIIKQWLAEGKIVVLDRYYTSNLIHQSAKLAPSELEAFIAWDEKMEFEIFKIPRPNLVIYLHLKAEIAHDWITKRGNGHDGHDTLEHMEIAEKQCLKLVKNLGWEKIECFAKGNPLTIPEIAESVWQKVESRLPKK